MDKRIDIYNYEKRIDDEIKKIGESKISDRNKKIIYDFRDSCLMEGLSKARITRILGTMRMMAERLGKDFDKATKKDIMDLVQKIQTNEKYSVLTKHTHKVILKKFYKWFKGDNERYPEEISWMKCNVKRSQLNLPSEKGLLTEKDIQKLMRTANNPRDKALISVVYESGCRIGEIMSCKINSITFDKLGCSLVVKGKTGSRKIRLIVSTPYLANWIEHHQFNDNPENPLWTNFGNARKEEHMNYASTRAIFRRLFKKAGIKKRSNPHLFRHSRATFLANHLTEFQMNHYFGWTQGSDMPSTYVHMSGKEVDDAILAINGEKSIEKKEEKVLMKSRKCPRCEIINGYDSKFCTRCGGVLDIQTAMEVEERQKQEIEVRNNSDELMNALIKDPQIQELLIKKVMEMGLGNKLGMLQPH